MAPTVSIVLPTYNRLKYLRISIDSVFAQTFQDWELLIVDDGSSGATENYLQTLADLPRVKVLWQTHTGNPPAVRNVALGEARGEYIAFLDSDDVWLPEKLTVQLASLQSRAACEWSCTSFTQVDDSGIPQAGTQAGRRPAFDAPVLDALLTGTALVAQSSVVARRELIQRLGGYDEELPVCGDYALWVLLAQHSEVDFIDAPLVLLRRHKEHYSDDITALEDLRRMLEKVQRSGAAAHLRAVLRGRRARVAVGIARAHALSRNRQLVLAALASSVRYSWSCRDWWRGALAAATLAFAPSSALRFIRKYRSGGHPKSKVEGMGVQ